MSKGWNKAHLKDLKNIKNELYVYIELASNVEVVPPLDQFKVHLSFEIKDGELNMQKQ